MQEIKFIEKGHQYFVDRQEYISVTTLIEKYQNPFNEEFWSRFKAIEQIFKNRYGDSKGIEKFMELRELRHYKAPGWFEWISLVEGIEETELTTVQGEILTMWAEDNAESLRKGSEYHYLKEEEAYIKGYSLNPFTKKNHRTAQKGSKPIGNLVDLHPGYYPELIIWNNEFRVIGTADRVFIASPEKKGGKKRVWIDDYKTNKEIKKQNLYQQMRYPLGRYDDCNYNHYRLQIGLYAWMLEQNGYEIKGTSINHLGQLYKMRYKDVRPMVTAMLNHYIGKDLIEMEGISKYGFSDVHLESK